MISALLFLCLLSWPKMTKLTCSSSLDLVENLLSLVFFDP